MFSFLLFFYSVLFVFLVVLSSVSPSSMLSFLVIWTFIKCLEPWCVHLVFRLCSHSSPAFFTSQGPLQKPKDKPDGPTNRQNSSRSISTTIRSKQWCWKPQPSKGQPTSQRVEIMNENALQTSQERSVAKRSFKKKFKSWNRISGMARLVVIFVFPLLSFPGQI